MNFIEISYASTLYQLEVELREACLRKPLDLTLSKTDLAHEDTQWHFGIMFEQELIACVVAKPVDPSMIKLRQMVVKPAYQSQGIGSLLLDNVIKKIEASRFKEIQLNARLDAIRFYEKHGFQQVGTQFIEVGIPHMLMTKNIG